MSILNCGVIGVGYLGKFHAEKYTRIARSGGCRLVAVADVAESVCRTAAKKYSTMPVADYRELLGKLDAVSIATPTPTHHRIARDFLKHGAHVLIEKPMTVSLDEADELIELAERSHRILQIGHVERFNPALLSLGDAPLNPMFVESTRLAPLGERSRERGSCVILDLMIHDLDIILDLVPSEISNVRANGAEVLSGGGSGNPPGGMDIANTRIEFTNGCTANVTASRISRKTERKLRLFKKNRYFSLDLLNNTHIACRRGKDGEIECNERTFQEADALLAEIEHFLECIREEKLPLVSGHAGRRALDAATQVTAALK